MPSVKDMRAGLAASVDSIAGLQGSPYMLGNPTGPSAEVVPSVIEYDKTFRRGYDHWRFSVRVMVGASISEGAQRKLDEFLAPTGAKSIKQAIETDTTLGGVVEDLRVVSCSGYRLYDRGGSGAVLGAEWEVEVWAEGS